MTDALVCSYMYLGMTTAMMITCRTPWCVLICLRACPTVHSLPSLSRAILAFCHTSIFLFRHFCFRVCVCIYAFACICVCICVLYLCCALPISSYPVILHSYPAPYPFLMCLCVRTTWPYLSYLRTCSTIHQLFWVLLFGRQHLASPLLNKSPLHSSCPAK